MSQYLSRKQIPGAVAAGAYVWRGPIKRKIYERRSAVQVPEQSPPVQEPSPRLPESRPVPLALLPAALTITVTAPVGMTLPAIFTATSPALASMPLEMRIG